MSVATTTTNYGLPIFAGTDHGNWFDFNAGFQTIDTAIKAAAQAAESAQTAAAAATKLANSASSLANSVNTNLTNLKQWITGDVTNANAEKISSIEQGTVKYNPGMNLISIRFKANMKTGQTISNDALVNLSGSGIIPPTTNRPIVSGLFATYGTSDNNYYTINMPSLLNTSNVFSINSTSPLPSNYDNTKQLSIYTNMLLCTDGWYD